uniref:arginine--tRNA ligase n=1 Tax=Albugo laibachii Nc14 TaxID=890382 RepID=F0WN27_9STRA|nr:arginyltRNA synthetase putative [Albugo laibachii Nc14]|eukprot:CCA22714.1 arginyltRNA synthetase putative [Albugo laibachii Nc14]
MTSTPPMKLFIDASQRNASNLKCLIAYCHTHPSSCSLHASSTAPKTSKIPFFPLLSIPSSNEQIVCANAICRFFAFLAEANAPETSLKPNDTAVDDWIEWEASHLAPLLLHFEQKHIDTAHFTNQLTKLLQNREKSCCLKTPFLTGESITLADIIVGASLRTSFAILSEISTEEMEKYSRYTAHLFAHKSFEEALEHRNAQTGSPDAEMMNGYTQHNLLYIVETLFQKAIDSAFPGLHPAVAVVDVTRTKNAQFGDYQCNSAMSIFTAMKGTPNALKSPRDVANAIINAMKQIENPVLQSELTVAGAGFINARLEPSFLSARLVSLLKHGAQASPETNRIKVVVDFSSPNIAKDMHVGHLRSTIIGDAICRILEFQGYDVARINHVGDWGTQFGMLICHLIDAYPTWESEQPNVTDLTKLYKAAKERFDQDEAFRQRSKDQVVLLQSGDSHSHHVWEILCDISRKEYQKVYDRLQVNLTEMGESYYNPYIPGVIERLEKKGITENSDGALVVFTKQFKQPFMLRKSDGSSLYDTTDIAALWYRIHEMQAAWIIYYTDYTQNDHFSLLFEVARMGGILDPAKHRVNHIGFGTVNDESGKRFKTRSGEVVRLVELLDEAKERMKTQLLDRIQGGQTSLPADQVDTAAEKIGYGAVKYFDLRQSPTSSYVFSYDRMLSTNGDTAVYLLFAYARLSSIIRKAGIDIASKVSSADPSMALPVVHPCELALALELLQFQDILKLINRDLSTNRLCSYLYTISEKVQTFLTQCRVIGCEEQENRLFLCQATVNVMQRCFCLLGIDPLDQI